jgi:hypothetical protein
MIAKLNQFSYINFSKQTLWNYTDSYAKMNKTTTSFHFLTLIKKLNNKKKSS